MTARPTRLTTIVYAGAALSLAFGAALLATAVPARAADDDVSLDKKMFRGILESLGLRKDGEAINYQERAPLVIPPSRALPPPERSDAVVANNPAWPKDPDIVRRKKQAEIERNRNISDERELEQNPLRADQMTPGGNPRMERRSQGDANTATPGDRLSAKELNQKTSIWSNMFGSKEDEVAKFTQEPPRASLTAPPPGYQTPSPDQPYGLSKETTKYRPTIPKPDDHGTVDSGR